MDLKVFVLLVVFAARCSCEQSKYTTKYDNIDIDRILSNRRILTNYIKCILDQGPCTPDGREFRSRAYKARYPDRNRHPREETFRNLLERFLESGSMQYKIRERTKTVLNGRRQENPTRIIVFRNIPDALQTGCQKCSEAQKKIVKKTSDYIRINRPDDWNKIRLKFDPEGKFSKSFEQFLNEK